MHDFRNNICGVTKPHALSAACKALGHQRTFEMQTMLELETALMLMKPCWVVHTANMVNKDTVTYKSFVVCRSA